MIRAPSEANLAHFISCLSVRSGLMIFFIKSCDIAVDRTRSSPAAVDSAAAMHPAMSSAMTHCGVLPMYGLAMTMMSLWTWSSLSWLMSGFFRRICPCVPLLKSSFSLRRIGFLSVYGLRALEPLPLYWMMPSLFLSTQASLPVFSNWWYQVGI